MAGQSDIFSLFPAALGQAAPSTRTGFAHARRENSLPRVVWLVCKDESAVHGALLLSSAEYLATDQQKCHWTGDAFVELQTPVPVAKEDIQWKSSIWHLSSVLDSQLKRSVARVGGTMAEHLAQFAGKPWSAMPLPQADLRQVKQSGHLVQFGTAMSVCRKLGVLATLVDAISDVQAEVSAELESFGAAAGNEHVGNKSCIVSCQNHHPQ